MKIKLISSVMLLTMFCLLAISTPVEARNRTRVSFNVNSGVVVPPPRVYVDTYRPYYSQGVYVAPGYYATPVMYEAPQPYCGPVVYTAPQPYYAPVMVAPAPQPVVGGGVSFSWRSRR